jgi:uncharacterized membrane protein
MVCMGDMALIGRLHPLLVHIPIGLALFAAAAEAIFMARGQADWRTAALASLRTSAPFGLAAAIAGWRLAASPGVEATPSLDWHRWLGTLAAVALLGAALATAGVREGRAATLWVYRIALFWAAALVAITAHLGGLLVWGADFLRL